ncbi:MAG: dihydroneopterin aldolase [Petrimonas sp.]|jgi:dihydroneopterin aldolase|nr:MAG: Dihydroneopterin aldolase [Bacteroidetes bacterium ADurb.BinA174]
MQTSILLKNMHFYAYHGVLPQERIVGNNFVVNVEFTADVSKSFETDNVEDTINYAEIYDLVKVEMAIPSQLIEHVAGRIFSKIKKSFPQIITLEVRLAKLNPPVSGEVAASEIIISDN